MEEIRLACLTGGVMIVGFAFFTILGRREALFFFVILYSIFCTSLVQYLLFIYLPLCVP